MKAAEQTVPMMPPAIAAAVNSVMKKATNVEKRGHNQFHNYDFAKVEDLLFALQPAMAEAGLFIIQSEHETTLLADGRLLRVQYAFKLAHMSGAVWIDPIMHSGMAGIFTPKGHLDDKCSNKCHTGARKYFLLGLTQIPVGNMPDSDADDPPGDGKPANKAQQPKTATPCGIKAHRAPEATARRHLVLVPLPPLATRSPPAAGMDARRTTWTRLGKGRSFPPTASPPPPL
jgi:hypothetical protein